MTILQLEKLIITILLIRQQSMSLDEWRQSIKSIFIDKDNHVRERIVYSVWEYIIYPMSESQDTTYVLYSKIPVTF